MTYKQVVEANGLTALDTNTALMDNAAVMPTKALSDLLGLSITGAVRWSTLAGTQGNAYAAEIVARTRPAD
ncbi:hypothetical protein [Nocardia fluminea]|uniref:hypothetical protein n=1 Tax=Nocardia fluminea TaxID=134984 RepID=UPI0033D7FC19